MNTTLRALVNQADRLVRYEAYEEALALCHAILRRYPRYAHCYRILGQAYLGLGEHEEAANLFRRALGVDAEDPIAYAGLGLIFASRGLLEEAIWQLERAFELAPGNDELRRELARLYQECGWPEQVRLTRGALARLYARGGLWNKAIGELRDLLAREPYRLDLWVTLARTLWRAGRREEAAATAQSILDQAPNCLVARLILGTYWCQEGREEEGRVLLHGAQELDPENREATRLLGAQSLLPLRVAHLEVEASVAEGAEELPWTDSLGQGTAELVEEPIITLPALRKDVVEIETANEPLPGAPEPVAAAPWPQERQPDGEPADVVEEEPEAEPPPALLSPLSVLQRRLDMDPADHEARLALARELVQSGRLAEALPLYDTLASPVSGYLDTALADLEALVRGGNEDRALRELLGDVYARAGRFQEAMETYRWLLAHSQPPSAAS